MTQNRTEMEVRSSCDQNPDLLYFWKIHFNLISLIFVKCTAGDGNPSGPAGRFLHISHVLICPPQIRNIKF